MKGLAHNLIMREKIETTVPRAKEVRSLVERMITVAKRQRVADLRTLIAKLPKQSAQKLFFDIASRYKSRNGGYTRIIKESKWRKRDGADLAVIEFVE